MKSSFLTALAVALGLLLMLTSSVSADAEPEECGPGPDAVVKEVPKEVRCTFSEVVRPAQSVFAVFDASGNQVDNKDTRLAPGDEESVTLLVTLNTSALSNGVYKVQWTTVSDEDGHRSQGEWSFTIAIETTTAPAEPLTAAQMPGPSPSELPAGMGGLLVRNFYGQQLTFSINGAQYTVPANDKMFFTFAPKAYTYSANVFGDDDTEAMGGVEIKAGAIEERGFYLIHKTPEGEEEEEP